MPASETAPLPCDRCKTIVRRTAAMVKDGMRVPLGIDCGCYGRWLHYRELWEFEATGVINV